MCRKDKIIEIWNYTHVNITTKIDRKMNTFFARFGILKFWGKFCARSKVMKGNDRKILR